MLFALALGLVIGSAAVLLTQQWLSGTLLLTEEHEGDLPAERFPHLAPPRAPSKVLPRPLSRRRRAA